MMIVNAKSDCHQQFDFSMVTEAD